MRQGIEVTSNRGIETVHSATALVSILKQLGAPNGYNFDRDTDVLTMSLDGGETITITSGDGAPGLHVIAAALSDMRANSVVRFNEYSWDFDCAHLDFRDWVPVPQKDPVDA